MNCHTLVLLQILYLEFQNSPSDYPNQIWIKIIQNWKILFINKNSWRSLSSERLKNIIKCEKYIKFFFGNLLLKDFSFIQTHLI